MEIRTAGKEPAGAQASGYGQVSANGQVSGNGRVSGKGQESGKEMSRQGATKVVLMNESEDIGFPEPIRSLGKSGQITPDEEALAKAFYRDVHRSGLLYSLVQSFGGECSEDMKVEAGCPETLARLRGVFSLLDSLDERLLATVCAPILEMRTSSADGPLRVEEVGRRVMGYGSPEANHGAGAALLRAAIWAIRLGYRNPVICNALLSDRSNRQAFEAKRQAA